MDRQAVYAYDFEGKRYDVGDKFGFIKATIDFALNRPDLKNQVREYLVNEIGPTLKELDINEEISNDNQSEEIILEVVE